MKTRTLFNRFAYIPPQCYTKTRRSPSLTSNPCYTCHHASAPPNYVDDAALQLRYQYPRAAAVNPWRNLLEPPGARTTRLSDAEITAYVRTNNYRDADNAIALRARLEPLPDAWDGEGDHRWDGYVPDAEFRFDAHGFDLDAHDRETGWRVFAYYPFPGTFFPTNGSMGDVLIRLDPLLRESDDGKPDHRVYEINLAIVEALITRQDVAIDRVDERVLGADLDLDGKLGVTTTVAFESEPDGSTRMRYVGRASVSALDRPFPIARGLYPLGTEFLHSLRYLDVRSDGVVGMAPRMKELRYARKTNWFDANDLKAKAARELVEARESATGARHILWGFDRGIYNGSGWRLQGFIEAADGTLRPQSYEETAYCAGCHGGIGATTDGMFAFARKLSEGPARGWFHWTQHDLHGLAEPRRCDGTGEYAFYLLHNGAGDEFRANDELHARFFDARGRLREDQLAKLRGDIGELLLPSAQRALELNRAYHAIVVEQSFALGRDVALGPSRNLHVMAPVGASTGVRMPLAASRCGPR